MIIVLGKAEAGPQDKGEKVKVKMKYMLHGYSGNVDDVIFYVDKLTGATLARKMFTFKDHKGQPPFRNAQKQIYAIKPSRGYQLNLIDYVGAFNLLPENKYQPMVTWSNAYNKLMYAMRKAMPGQVDLKTITRAQIYAQNLPCLTVKAAIEAGLLPMVKDYERWDMQI